jgi:hypothetical protein
MMISSRNPTTGIKSGIRSMGLSKYKIAKRATNFANRGVLESRMAKYSTKISLVNDAAPREKSFFFRLPAYVIIK